MGWKPVREFHGIKRLSENDSGAVIARSVFCDKAISAVRIRDCFGKKRLTMTIFLVLGQPLKG
jgi:hypothetical protein